MNITAKELSEASGVSLRKAYYVRGGQATLSPDEAARAEKALGIHRLCLLYPNEFDEAGHPLPSTSQPERQEA